mmetsp:Transcript_20749/g.51470  ORF Transcript_20749/g.51470 Transcript_20749/m.51470 type:complete len:780 (+) Transcript_20749:232-2571(+)
MARSVAPEPPQHQRQGMSASGKGLMEAKMNGLLQDGVDNIEPGPSMDAPFPNSDKEFFGSDDYSIEPLTKQFVTAAVISPAGEIPNLSSALSDEYRVDYTNEVRRKYFDIQEKHESNLNHGFAIPQREGYHKIYDGIPSKITTNNSYVPASNQSSLSSRGGEFHVKWSNDNAKTNKILTKASGPHTPPLTLYSGEGVPPLALPSTGCPDTPDISSNNDDSKSHHIRSTDELVGPLSPMPGMDNASFGQNTQASHAESLTPDLNSVSDYTQPVGSLYSAASSRGGSLIKQPVLYSAIGSLELANNNSLTDLNKRFMQPSKDFCRPGGAQISTVHSRLIPPARQYQNGQRKSHTTSALQAEMSKQNLQTSQDKNQADTSSSALNTSLRENSSTTKIPAEIDSSIRTNVVDNKKSNTRKSTDGRERSVASASTNDETTKATTKIEKRTSRRDSQNNNSQRRRKSSKKVSYDASTKGKKSKSKTVEMFRPSSDAYTPRIERKKIKYKAAEARPCVQQMSSPMGTLQRPNFRDALRRVAMIIHQHIVKIESRFEKQGGQYNRSAFRTKAATDDGLFHASMRDIFHEDTYRTPTYKCNMARIPMARPGMTYGLRKIKVMYEIPSETEIYNFGHQLFKTVQLSSECSIVCLIYVERLMEVAKVPLLACTWRPIFMCGLLLASKVWQDLSSWNIEFSSVYPQFSLEAINKLELNFLRNVKWDLYISSSSYAKYYFALRSLVEKKDFRQRYNRMVGGVGNVAHSEALKVQERTERVKEEALLQLSRSM